MSDVDIDKKPKGISPPHPTVYKELYCSNALPQKTGELSSASRTGELSSTSRTGELSSASRTGELSSATRTGELSTFPNSSASRTKLHVIYKTRVTHHFAWELYLAIRSHPVGWAGMGLGLVLNYNVQKSLHKDDKDLVPVGVLRGTVEDGFEGNC
ncbi:hypothetical protein BC829DRAFT_446323 [Chytridium lagenaria]|nr:hypothetical protein BC829DRAFT_446323 [Chytridium lagenaria]